MARILLVEDDQFTRELYDQILTEAGHTIDLAVDGEEGWNKASVGGYDLVLLDVVMPKLDGMTLLKRLHATPAKTPNKKIVMLTVMNQDEFIKDALASGADGYLMKSALTPDQVVSEINAFLE